MQAAIELTPRQTARVLEQALRAHVRLEIELAARDERLAGRLLSRQDGLLLIELPDPGPAPPLTSLIGAFCDVTMILSGQRYLFATCVADYVENTLPQRLRLAVPEVVQVTNRRRFDRLRQPHPAPLQLWVTRAPRPWVGTLTSLGPAGLGGRLPRAELDDLLLIEDEVRVGFHLPSTGESFDLAAVVCFKTPTLDGQRLDVGLELCVPQPDEPTQRALERLRTALAHGYTRSRSPGESA